MDVVNALRDLGVLVSVPGPEGNVLRVRPPLVFTDDDVALLLARLDEALTRCTAGAPR